MSFDKVDATAHFLDLSDYARPIARILTRLLVPTPISPIHITIVYTCVGLSAALLFASGSRLNLIIGGILLLVKSTLDAVDGSLARARQRPSRVGRFLDSICDYLINAAIFLGLAASGQALALDRFILALVALESATWQGTAFNYYYVYYRTLTRGDTTSHLQEDHEAPYPWDNPTVLRLLLKLYQLIYGWQDRLLGKLDRQITPDRAAPIYRDRRLLTATTAMGLGFQLLVIALLAWLDHAEWALWFFVGPMNLYWVIIILIRYRAVTRRNTGSERPEDA
jgi:phosphatidylglycerophosphate synthase